MRYPSLRRISRIGNTCRCISTIFHDFKTSRRQKVARAEECLTSPIAVVRSKRSNARRITRTPEGYHPTQMPIRGILVIHLEIITWLHSSSLSSSSSSVAAAAFLAGFFFFLFLFLGLASFDRGCSRILRISSSVIFLSVLNLDRSGAGGAASFCIPFLVMARKC
jgi:hypothetical protein